jgi:hypothetical protein
MEGTGTSPGVEEERAAWTKSKSLRSWGSMTLPYIPENAYCLPLTLDQIPRALIG